MWYETRKTSDDHTHFDRCEGLREFLQSKHDFCPKRTQFRKLREVSGAFNPEESQVRRIGMALPKKNSKMWKCVKYQEVQRTPVSGKFGPKLFYET